MKIKTKMIFSAALGCVVAGVATRACRLRQRDDPDEYESGGGRRGYQRQSERRDDELFGDPAIAKGKGFEIKQSQLDAAMLNIKTAAAARGQTISPDRMNLLKLGTLDRLIDLQLLLQKATDADKAEGRQDFEKSLQELKTSLKLTDAEFDQKLNQQLQLQNMTKEKWRQENIDQATALDALKRELNVKVTEADAKKFYDEHPADFERPEEVRFARIFMSTRDSATGAELSDTEKAAKKTQMEDVLKRARAGDSFTNLVAKYSEDPSVQENNGEYTIARGQTPPEFEAGFKFLQGFLKVLPAFGLVGVRGFLQQELNLNQPVERSALKQVHPIRGNRLVADGRSGLDAESSLRPIRSA